MTATDQNAEPKKSACQGAIHTWFEHNGERDVEGCCFTKVVTPVEKRNAVGHLCEEDGVSQRRACDVLSVDRSSVQYRSIRSDDADVRKAMKEVAAERRRFG